MAGLSARVQQLTRENSTYRETVDSLTRQVDKNARLVSFLSSDSVKTVKLRSTEAGGKSSGQAFIVDGQKVVFYATGLPRLTPGRVYQLWLLRGKNPEIVSGGVLRSQGDQRVAVEFADRALVGDINGVAVTEEPEGGSAGPTGHKLLVGTSGSPESASKIDALILLPKVRKFPFVPAIRLYRPSNPIAGLPGSLDTPGRIRCECPSRYCRVPREGRALRAPGDCEIWPATSGPPKGACPPNN